MYLLIYTIIKNNAQDSTVLFYCVSSFCNICQRQQYALVCTLVHPSMRTNNVCHTVKYTSTCFMLYFNFLIKMYKQTMESTLEKSVEILAEIFQYNIYIYTYSV